jgi:hypothetical protein
VSSSQPGLSDREWATFVRANDDSWKQELKRKNRDENRQLQLRFSKLVQDPEEVDELDRFAAASKPFTTTGQQAEVAEDNELKDIEDEAAIQRDLAAETGAVRESTITTSERKAFQRIFSDIMARSKHGGAQTAAGILPFSGEKSRKVDTEKATSRKRGESLSLVNETGKRNENIQAAVQSYPLALRAAAARALGLASEQATLKAFEMSSQAQETQITDELEHLRQPERERVEKLMRSAKTDFELWHVMDKHVFSLVGKLDTHRLYTTTQPQKRRGRKAKQQALAEGLEPTDSSNINSAGVSSLHLLGPLYPSHLLLGLRLLDRSFAKPSPLVLNILPRIKALGLISQVLGASAAFYNELIRIVWNRHDDFRGALALLEEMEQAGLDLDGNTLDVVGDIKRMQSRVRRGDKGTALQALWSLPEFAPHEFHPWQRKIQAAMEERGHELAQDLP